MNKAFNFNGTSEHITIPDTDDFYFDFEATHFSSGLCGIKKDKYGNILKIWMHDVLVYERNDFMSKRFLRRN